MSIGELAMRCALENHISCFVVTVQLDNIKTKNRPKNQSI